ncbi:pollen-specific leucine-rich repeat extensin-like protein 2 [Photinus pyralis]|uniref:pollen-specific leucine-rich repeat extensin-like protein 2 n=1 Tax=Photinus pyralis TaxID=7054 RepID=UPI0012671CDF|nr:pollen-specific leucine-rich repeat extensin-like protein 2 [Photinus pyralis]
MVWYPSHEDGSYAFNLITRGPRENAKPMISAGIEGRLPYMTYPEPWGGPPKQPPEFLRPAPKPLPPNRYNGVHLSSSLNGTRQPQRQPSKYPSPPAATPVNLTQQKEESTEELPYSAYSRLFPPPPPFMYHPSGPYTSLYQPPYTPPLRANYPQPPPLSPLEPPYTPTTPSATGSAIFLTPSATFSPPAVVQQQPSQTITRVERKPSPSFKVPSGKEGSLKHRILTRPGDSIHLRHSTDAQKPNDGPKLSEATRKRLTATVSPPRSPAKTGTSNVVPVGNFTKGSLIQLANGELRRVEDMRTEDFVNSAERSPELRLADSTVVRIEENPITGTGTVTLSYNQRRTQVEFEASLEHPFFVYGQGWASCAPDRTLQIYGLKVHRLQVGDILISLTPREATSLPASTRGSTIITTATTTAVTARQVSSTAEAAVHSYHVLNPGHPVSSGVSFSQQSNVLQTVSSDCSNSKKRRWSAPDQICDENEQNVRRVKT